MLDASLNCHESHTSASESLYKIYESLPNWRDNVLKAFENTGFIDKEKLHPFAAPAEFIRRCPNVSEFAFLSRSFLRFRSWRKKNIQLRLLDSPRFTFSQILWLAREHTALDLHFFLKTCVSLPYIPIFTFHTSFFRRFCS